MFRPYVARLKRLVRLSEVLKLALQSLSVRILTYTTFGNAIITCRPAGEHIIRDGDDYERIVNYIRDNPLNRACEFIEDNWEDDDLYL